MVYWRLNGKEKIQTKKFETKTQIPRDIKNILSNDNHIVYLALANNKMIGWTALCFIPKLGMLKSKGHVYVDELWVEPSFRNKGIGKKLMKMADEWAFIKGSIGIRLYVNQDNYSAQRLYKNCGFNNSAAAIFMEKKKK